jgi:broad specificity phosphatase PhoE
MAVEITFLGHARSLDNERGVASGHVDVDLAESGVQGAQALAAEYGNTPVDTVFTSDLKRAVRTAELIFRRRRVPLVQDSRLREADYGSMGGLPVGQVSHADHISQPFPGGESYQQVMTRMRSFLVDLLARNDGQHVFIIGHRATRYGLEHWVNGLSIADAIAQQIDSRLSGKRYSLGQVSE